MNEKLDSLTLSKQLQQVDDEKYELAQKKRLLEDYQDYWLYLQRNEQDLLGEVAYLSHQTVSAKHAGQELDSFEENKRKQDRFFEGVEEEFAQKKKKLSERETQLNEEYVKAKSEEAKND